ncbi:MAG: tRNA pseudouridine(55) synthase TruB [Lachnospiraceae bacterium]|nr:tRNA pseudouridine(55) synthase TruB [Lachnospiraceae bacterium]
MDGILIINKEQGYTSFDVVAVLRKVFGQKRIGHGGTLDPMAEGVLPVFLGSATGLMNFLGEADKCYEAGILLGKETDTEDIWGNVLREAPVNVTEEEVRAAVKSFEGVYSQVPPMYSAKKRDGKKLYELAREGVTVEREAVPVSIRSIGLIKADLPEFRIRVVCSKGTYIRSLARDIGKKLGTGACMTSLLRVSHGGFSLDVSHTVPEVREAKENGALSDLVIPLDEVLSAYPKLFMTELTDKLLMNGNRIPEDVLKLSESPENGALYRAYLSDGRFAALYRYSAENGCFRAEKMFLPGNG